MTWRQDGEVEELAGTLPADPESLLDAAKAAVVALNAAAMASDGAAFDEASNRYQTVIWKLNGGTWFGCAADRDGPQARVEQHCRAAPGAVPMWGQLGEFLIEVDRVRSLVAVSAGWGDLHNFHFEFRVVDFDRPFISETGYRSHFETAHGGMTVDQVAAALFADFLRSARRYVPAAACRLQEALPAWLVRLAPAPSRLIQPDEAEWLAVVPPGFVLVDVVLPAVKAYQVVKWAKVAKGRLMALRAEVDAKKKSRSGIAKTDDAAARLEVGRRYRVKPSIQHKVAKVVVVANVLGESAFAYDDVPIRYKTNRNGRRVVEHDPRCIQTVYHQSQLVEIQPETPS